MIISVSESLKLLVQCANIAYKQGRLCHHVYLAIVVVEFTFCFLVHFHLLTYSDDENFTNKNVVKMFVA